MNVIVVSGEVVNNAVIKGKPGFNVAIFQIKNTVGFGEYAKHSVLNVKKMGKSVANVAKYITAGKKINVSGELIMETFQANGVTKSLAVINAHNIDLGYDEKKPKAQDSGNDFDPDQTAQGQEPQADNEPDYFG